MTLLANTYGRVVINTTSGLMVPKGTGDPAFAPGTPQNQRPQLSGVRQPIDANGTIRYNTSTNPITGRPYGLEAYVDGNWEIVRAPGANTITKQTLGPGDDVETIFGPLDIIPSADDNILVFVENVFQISVTNYNVLYNYLGSGDAYIEFTSEVPTGKFITIYYGFSN
jgi:hypothetical protein